jgi:hypothetical protein
MKLRRLIFSGAAVLALTASFAFKMEKQGLENVYFHPVSEPLECAIGNIETPNDCESIYTGPVCTVLDWTGTGEYVTAYADIDGAATCYYTLHHEY